MTGYVDQTRMWTTAGGRFLTPGRGRPWDVAPDGRFLMIKESGTGQELQMAPQINVVLNWHQELLERAPVD